MLREQQLWFIRGWEVRDECTDTFQFIKEGKNLKLWSHWHTFPGLFLNTLGCPSHILHSACKGVGSQLLLSPGKLKWVCLSHKQD